MPATGAGLPAAGSTAAPRGPAWHSDTKCSPKWAAEHAPVTPLPDNGIALGAVGCCLTFERLHCPLPAVRLLWDAMSGVRNESDDAAFGAAAGNIESMVTAWFGTDAGSVTVVHHGCENLGKLDLTAAAFGAETKHLTAASANKGGGFPDSAYAHCGPHSQPLPLKRPSGFLPFMDLRDAFVTAPSKGAGLILSTPRMLESVNSGAQRGAGGHVGLIGATLPT